ncbi:metalloregulator ArsR/SmtB family transcription factor [Microaerobacter geothermalis]|uniref:ArsR/SmtB family transcription factor n=1 Tax=Microaerobacter geothermalis TaxID=674972 RepID=UPI001F166530|nr:metalloregulator ArsR/SmtB family transcription factor [Microaerobacter geothermalis]MCF6093038.1 metalloregulator ArsR/SmtB family transcription factor [Microaerobacter geothermalis]
MTKELEEICADQCGGTVKEVIAGIKKTMIDEETAAGIADIFKALGDPTRVKIIYALLQKELCVHDITVILDMGQSAISHQLRYLRNLRIVKRRKEGKTVFYSLDDLHIELIFKETLQHVKHQ